MSRTSSRTSSERLMYVQFTSCVYGDVTAGSRAINDTYRERLMFHSIQYRNGWLAASDLFDMFTQSIKFYTFHFQYRCLKNAIHQIDSKNGWLLLSTGFTAKFGLVFVFTLEKDFSQKFHFQTNRKSLGSSKKRYQGFSKQSSV